MAKQQPDLIAALLPGLRAGDEAAFAGLYDKFAALLFGVIVRIVPDRVEAENLLQDCFLKIWQYIDQYNPEKGRLTTWMINIARNTAIDFTRSKYFNNKRKNHSIENFVTLESGNTDPEAALEFIGLRGLVGRLTPAYRQVLEWMYFEGYTQQEIADEFQIPLGTVKSRARLGLQELRRFYLNTK